MTTIMIELDDASNIEKLLAYIKRLKGHKKVQITDAEKDILAAMHQMDNGIYHAVTREELFAPTLEPDYGEEGVPQRVADNIVSGLVLIKKSERGEVELQNAYDLLKELREEAVMA